MKVETNHSKFRVFVYYDNSDECTIDSTWKQIGRAYQRKVNLFRRFKNVHSVGINGLRFYREEK